MGINHKKPKSEKNFWVSTINFSKIYFLDGACISIGLSLAL